MFKFKGTKPNGEPVFGQYFHNKKYDEHCIIDDDGNLYLVDPKTVGPYIGLKDKNQLEVYVGDELTDKKGDIYKIISEKGQCKLEPLDKANTNSFASFNIEAVCMMELRGD